MKKFKFIFSLLLLIILPFTFSYRVKADEILVVDEIKQITNAYNVDFKVISNYEVSALYDDVGDTLEFEVTLRNQNSKYNAQIKSLDCIKKNDGVDYTAALVGEKNLEVKPGETKKIKVVGTLNEKAKDGYDVVKLQLKYTISEKACTDCNKDLPVNPQTSDNIRPVFLVAGISILAIIVIIVILFFVKKKNKKIMGLILALLLNAILSPLYNVKADSEYMIEILINQTIKINKADDHIRVTPIEVPYDGDEHEPNYEDDSNTPIHPTYYEDETCQNPINGKPVEPGKYYATATSDGNTWYNEGTLSCQLVVTINDSSAPAKCNKLSFNGDYQELITGGSHVSYENNIGKSAGDYTVKVIAESGYAFSDGSTEKNVKCTIDKKEIIVTAKDQEIEYGSSISNDVNEVTVTGLVDPDQLSGIKLTPSTTSVTDNGTINVDTKNVVITREVSGETSEVTHNYTVKAVPGKLKIYYKNTFVDGNNCKVLANKEPQKSYSNSITLPSFEAEEGYTPRRWDVTYNDAVTKIDLGSNSNPANTKQINLNDLHIKGNNTYKTICEDITPPDINSFDVNPGVGNFTVDLDTSDKGSGVETIEWYFKKCTEDEYKKVKTDTFNPSKKSHIATVNSGELVENVCLTYGTYDIKIVVKDAAGNVTNSQEKSFTLKVPDTSQVKLDDDIGQVTACNSAQCAIDKLLKVYFNAN